MASYEIYGFVMGKNGLNKEQKARKIQPADIASARSNFGNVVANQMARDANVAFAFWDSCSMIEQGWADYECDKPVSAFVSWFKERLGINRPIFMGEDADL